MNDEKRFAGKALECPAATKDVFENTKNRDWTIENFGYGPLNPDFPDEGTGRRRLSFGRQTSALLKLPLRQLRCVR